MKRLFTACIALALLLVFLPAGSLSVAAASADLVVTDFTWNAATEITPGTAITFFVTVKNESDGVLPGPFTATFGTPAATFSSVTYTESIAPGASITIKSQPWTAVAGDYMVAVRVEAGDSVTETNKANNTAQANLRVARDKLTSAYAVTQSLLDTYDLDSLIFSEDFDDLSSVDTANSGKEGYKWYVARAFGASTLTTNDYSVENGVMTVHTEKPTYNYGLDTYNCQQHVGFVYNKGYMEIRLRIPRARKNQDGEKGSPAIWALPPEKLENRAKAWVEVDWLEYWGIGAYDTNTPNGFYTICLHQQHLTGSTVTTHFKNSNYRYEGLGDGQWHVMGWLWQDGLFVAYLDGVEIMRQTYSSSNVPSPYVNTMKTDGTLTKTGVYSMLDTQYNPIIIGGSKDNPLELDYVRVWNNSHTPSTEPNASGNPEQSTATAPTTQETTPVQTTEGTVPTQTTEGTVPTQTTTGTTPTQTTTGTTPTQTATGTTPTQTATGTTPMASAPAEKPVEKPNYAPPALVYVAVPLGIALFGGLAWLLLRRKPKKK